MPVSNHYQAQPDCYVRFDWGGISLEGEFFSYEEYGRDIDPKWGYNLNTEFLKWVTPFYTPLRYERKWLTKHRKGLLRFGALVAVAVFAYIHYG